MAEDDPAENIESYRSSFYSMDQVPFMPGPYIRPAPHYPNTSVKEDEEGRLVELDWDLLQPAFMVAFQTKHFQTEHEKYLCLGIAMKSDFPGYLVLMSLEFYSLDKAEKSTSIGRSLVLYPFEFIAMKGVVPNVQVLEHGEDRVLHLVNETYQFEYSLTKLKDGEWSIEPLPKPPTCEKLVRVLDRIWTWLSGRPSQ